MDRSEKLAQKIRIAALNACQGLTAPRLSVDTLAAHINDSDWILIDVRSDSEIAVSQLPHALSPEKFAAKFRLSGIPKQAHVLTYCTIGYRSGKFAEQLISKGIAAHNLEGGILAWVQAGHEVVQRRPDGSFQPVKEVHVYAKEWNLLPPGYTAKW